MREPVPTLLQVNREVVVFWHEIHVASNHIVDRCQVVTFHDAWPCHQVEVATTVRIASHALRALVCYVGQAFHEVLRTMVRGIESSVVVDEVITTAHNDHASIRVAQLEVAVDFRCGFHFVGPNRQESTSRNHRVDHAVVVWNLVFQRVVDVIAEIETCHIQVCVGVVVKLNPIAIVEIFVHIHTVAGTYLVHLDRIGVGDGKVGFFHRLIASHKMNAAAAWQSDGFLCGEPVDLVRVNRLLDKFRIPIHVR